MFNSVTKCTEVALDKPQGFHRRVNSSFFPYTTQQGVFPVEIVEYDRSTATNPLSV